MSTELNVAAIERARGHWNVGNLDGYLELYSPEVVLHGYVGVEPGFSNVRRFYEAFSTAFPGSRLTYEDVFAAGDRVACRFVVHGTHKGPFQGLPATGKVITLPGITILRFAEGKCAERWSQADFLGLLAQLGVAPSLG